MLDDFTSPTRQFMFVGAAHRMARLAFWRGVFVGAAGGVIGALVLG